VSASTTLYASPRRPPAAAQQVTLLDLLDRLLAGGVVVAGQIRLAAADIELVDLDVTLLLTAVDKVLER
jgi:hypothetical protein